MRQSGRSRIKLIGSHNEVILLVAILVLSLVIGLKSPSFFSIATVFDLFRSSIIEIIFALGVLIVIVSGGIDVSFPVIGIFAGYSTIVIMMKVGISPGSLIIPLLISMTIGTILGGINAIAIAGFGLPTLIATLGTAGIFRGFLLSFVGSLTISNIPNGLDAFSMKDLIVIGQSGGTIARLHILIIPVVILVVLISLMLNRTMFGRAIYALGGEVESARRLGLAIRWTQARIYLLVGTLSGFAGIIYVSLQRMADPYALAGTELNVIAAVVLGGASIMGGYGTVFGTVLGVLLINLITDNLVLLGIPGSWQRAAVGLLLFIGVSGQALSNTFKNRASKKLAIAKPTEDVVS